MNAKHLRYLRVTGQPGQQRRNPKCAPLFTTVWDQGGLVHSQSGLLNWGGEWRADRGGSLRPHWTLDKLNGKNMHKCLAQCLPPG